MTQAEFLQHLEATKQRAIKTGKFTRLGSGQYFYHAQNTLYYVAKYGEGENAYWGWCVNGSHPDDACPTLADAKASLMDYLDTQQIVHGITLLQLSVLESARCAKGDPVYYYDEPYKTQGVKNAVKKLVSMGLILAKVAVSTSRVTVWVNRDENVKTL